MLYLNRDKSKVVPEGDPEAAYLLNPNAPGDHAGLLNSYMAEQSAAQEAEAEKAAKKAEAAPAEPDRAEARAVPASEAKAVAAPVEDKAARAPTAAKGRR